MKAANKILVMVLTAAMLISSGCGYVLYPERQGAKSGRIDPVVAVLDALGLLFYVVPGVVAFAVDFTNGTIFVPPGGQSALDKHRRNLSSSAVDVSNWQGVSVDGEMTPENIARTLSDYLGTPISALSIEMMSAASALAYRS